MRSAQKFREYRGKQSLSKYWLSKGCPGTLAIPWDLSGSHGFKTIFTTALKSYFPFSLLVPQKYTVECFRAYVTCGNTTDWLQIQESSCLLLRHTIKSFAQCKIRPLFTVFVLENIISLYKIICLICDGFIIVISCEINTVTFFPVLIPHRTNIDR